MLGLCYIQNRESRQRLAETERRKQETEEQNRRNQYAILRLLDELGNLAEGDLTVQASVPIARCEVVEAWESRHYLEKTPVSVLEVEIHQPGTLTTQHRWAA